MIALDKTGTHLKYFSQKQDVILIRNLLSSIQHRWEKIVSRSAERTRHLERGYKEAKQVRQLYHPLLQIVLLVLRNHSCLTGTMNVAGSRGDVIMLVTGLLYYNARQLIILLNVLWVLSFWVRVTHKIPEHWSPPEQWWFHCTPY